MFLNHGFYELRDFTDVGRVFLRFGELAAGVLNQDLHD